jgi:hypothetical protein
MLHFKVQYKKKLSKWVLSQFDSSTTRRDSKKTMPSVRHVVMYKSQEWRETNPQIQQNNQRMSKILHTNESVEFAMDDRRGK